MVCNNENALYSEFITFEVKFKTKKFIFYAVSIIAAVYTFNL